MLIHLSLCSSKRQTKMCKAYLGTKIVVNQIQRKWNSLIDFQHHIQHCAMASVCLFMTTWLSCVQNSARVIVVLQLTSVSVNVKLLR